MKFWSLPRTTSSVKFVCFTFFILSSFSYKVFGQGTDFEFGIGIVNNRIYTDNNKNVVLENFDWIDCWGYSANLRYRANFGNYLSFINVSFEDRNYQMVNERYPSIKSKYNNCYLTISTSIGRYFYNNNVSFSVGMSYSRWLKTSIRSHIAEITSVESTASGFEKFNLIRSDQIYQFKDYDVRDIFGYNLSYSYYFNRFLYLELCYSIDVNFFKKIEPIFKNHTARLSTYFSF